MSVRYYDENAETYFDTTVSADMNHVRDAFLKHIPQGGQLLDAGCGSGRDAKAFADQGYQVTAFDASAEMVRLARKYTSLEVRQMTFDQMEWQDRFDGIWACATLLHVARSELADTFKRFARALKPNGAWFISMKLGTSTREIEGRTFTDVTEVELESLLVSVGLCLSEMWLTDDVRPGRSDRWVNAIAVRQ
jgi:2-polyprenyl-3-methyl-5-hydroxy-6-metoxy-1,4-benzoquinol methylase